MNSNINKILEKLVSSQDLCKYLYYDSDNPIAESDIDDPSSSLLYKKIFPYPTSTEIFKDADGKVIAKSVINVLFDDFRMGSQNTKFKYGKLIFVILCHTSLWRLQATGQLRPYCILNEIDEMFSEQRVIGIGKGEFESCSLTWSDQNYSGYKLVYKNYEFL